MAADLPGLELQDAPQPLAVGLVTASALPGMPSYAPMLDGKGGGIPCGEHW